MEHLTGFVRVIRAIAFITSIALAFLIVRPARAQNVGSLQGIVTDAGASMAGITITAPDLSSNVSHPTTSGADGGGSSVIVREEVRQLQGGAL